MNSQQVNTFSYRYSKVFDIYTTGFS